MDKVEVLKWWDNNKVPISMIVISCAIVSILGLSLVVVIYTSWDDGFTRTLHHHSELAESIARLDHGVVNGVVLCFVSALFIATRLLWVFFLLGIGVSFFLLIATWVNIVKYIAIDAVKTIYIYCVDKPIKFADYIREKERVISEELENE